MFFSCFRFQLGWHRNVRKTPTPIPIEDLHLHPVTLPTLILIDLESTINAQRRHRSSHTSHFRL